MPHDARRGSNGEHTKFLLTQSTPPQYISMYEVHYRMDVGFRTRRPYVALGIRVYAQRERRCVLSFCIPSEREMRGSWSAVTLANELHIELYYLLGTSEVASFATASHSFCCGCVVRLCVELRARQDWPCTGRVELGKTARMNHKT